MRRPQLLWADRGPKARNVMKLASRLSERMQLSIDLLDSFKNRPPTPETRKNDVAFVTSITTKF